MQIYRVSIAVLFLGAILTPAWSADVTEAVALFDSYVKAVNEDDLPAELKLCQQDRDVISVVGDQVSVGIEAVRRARTVSQRWTALDVLTLRAYELGDSSVNFLVRPWVDSADYWGVLWDTTEKVKLQFDAEGISIPYPQMDVHLDKPE